MSIYDSFFHNNRGEKHRMHQTMEGPMILKSEVKATLAKMKMNKAARSDEIITEMLTNSDDKRNI